MDINIINEAQSVIPRKEIMLEVKFEKSTPKRLDLKKEIAKKTKSKEELLILKKILTDYGNRTAKVTAYVYKDEETLKKIEYAKVIEKNTPKKEQEPEAQESKEEPKEAPKEEPKEEVKKESKEAPKEEPKEEVKKESKEAPKEEAKETPKEEPKEAPKKEPREEEAKEAPKEEK